MDPTSRSMVNQTNDVLVTTTTTTTCTTTTTTTIAEQQVQELRAALDEQLELVRSLSDEEQLLEWSVEEQLANMVMIASRYPQEILYQAVLTTYPPPPATTSSSSSSDQGTTPTTTTTTTYTGRLPLHLACDTNAPIEIIRWLLDHDINKESILVKDKWGDLPIHTACSRQNVEVVKLLLDHDIDKSTILTPDYDGALPIHMACRYVYILFVPCMSTLPEEKGTAHFWILPLACFNSQYRHISIYICYRYDAPAEVIHMLLEHDKHCKSLLVGAISNQLPLHIACRCNLPPASIAPLLEYDVNQQTVLIQDSAGRLPLHVAYLRNSHSQVMVMLLQAMLYGRISRIGLDLWKRDMKHMLASLTQQERDFNANDKLEITRQAWNDFMERVHVVELVIWRMSCVRDTCNSNNGNDNATDDPALILQQLQLQDDNYKKERHIKSGADIIIPGVVSFLEDEPIVQIQIMSRFA